MLEVKVFDGEKNVKLQFEHSLLSVSKWESRTKKPFNSTRVKTAKETYDYYEDMLVDPNVDRDLIVCMSTEQLEEVGNYINDIRTASSVPVEPKKSGSDEVMTSELIYYWLTEFSIPFHPTETWHLSRCLMLIQITAYKKTPPKKRNFKEVVTDWAAINEKQKKMFNTSG